MVTELSNRTVLIVDDELTFLNSLIEGLKIFSDDFNTLTATDGMMAVEVLKSTHVDLVVTDLNMPRMDGLELLAYMSGEHPQIPIIVMSAYCTPEIKSKIDGIGVLKILEKPIGYAGLVDTIFSGLAALSEGHIRGVSLPAFLQLVEMENKTCTLKVESNEGTGFLHFRDGMLIEAENRDHEHERAAYEIVCWDDPKISIESICRKKTGRIRKTLGHILMEGFRLKDEKTRKEPTVDKGASQRSPMSVAGKPRTVCEELEKEDNKKSEPPSGTENREAAMATAQDILKEFAGQQGVEAVCLVGRDGFLLDSISRTGIDAETVGAIASTGFGSSESIGGQLGKGELNMSMIEFENGPVMFSPVGSDAFVVIIADKQANLGMIRLKLKKYSSELALAVSF